MKKKYLIADFEARSVALIADSLLVPRTKRAAPVASAKSRGIAPLLLSYAAARVMPPPLNPLNRPLAHAF